ncbi:hypothetical protein JRQ81_009144 [Phrynocephalus forsythii]|uniref:Rho guanine nucleotide exchange factor 11 n=1 Tax=Phrynocephalus forsythii TaxID=171643 RepID=A0A9Q1AS92_9SAUR|nr:hypothetical protein JRQ81_009144 [Phrynocephalus forsythii]
MNMRPPQTALDRLSSLSSLGDSALERRSPGHPRQLSDSSGESTGLVQRCVIIQKDQHGFGFTVSGDRIVLVQSVRPGGAAMRAGVQEGDRIVKVNGTMVSNSSHLEVVKLIKSGAYVALTLLGSPPASTGFPGSQLEGPQPGGPQVLPACPPPLPPPPLPPPQRITGPRPFQDPEVQKHATQILHNMLRQEEAELQRCYEVYSRQPASLLEEQIEGAQRRVSQLQLKIRQEMMGGPGDPTRLPSDSFSSRPADGRLDPQDGDSGLDFAPERFPSVTELSLQRTSVFSDPGLESPQSSPIIPSRLFQHHRRQGSDTAFSPSSAEQSLDRTPRPLIIGPEEDCDLGSFNHEGDSLFQDLAKLKMRPAHLGVFLRYIFSQGDPSPLLLYLCVDVYQQMSPKEARGFGRDLWHIFLEKAAPLRVKIPDHLLAEIDARLRNGEDARSAFLEAQEAVMAEIQEQIQDYRTKRTLGLGSLYGENDLTELDGDPQKERQVAEKQIAHLGDILAPMSFALNTYMSHIGLRPREARPVSVVEKAQEKDKWLPFFPKTKKSSSVAEDKRRNPILKYIGKPKSSSQSTFHVPLSPVEVKPGNVRNIIQHFENNQHYEGQEPSLQRLSTGSFPEDLLEPESSRSEVRLGRSESLKGREELRRLRKADNVPRSRSDVDMEAAVEAARLHQSASSSASSLSARSLENPTPPYTPKMGRRSIESPGLGFGSDAFLPHLLEDELGPPGELEQELDAQNWQHTVGREVVASLPQREVDRQEVINELFVTEASHLRTLRVLDTLFYQRMKKENLLSREEIALIFPNLPELIEIHNSLSESMKRLREDGPIVKEIGDLMLSRFDGPAREEIQRVAADFCAYQSVALELIKSKKRKESRFQLFMQEAESQPQCRRLQLKDLIISEMQRLTKYPLLLENVLKHSHGNTSEYQKLCRARDQCREILRHVNEAVRRAENEHRLEAYQKRLDATPLERTSHPLAAEFKNLDLQKRRMIHEGLLSWRISKDKTVDLLVLLLEDLLVLLQRQDEKLVLKCHSKSALGSSSDTKQTFSPVLKLNSVLIRSVATDKRALFIICTSELGPQIYELVASTSSEKNTLVLQEADLTSNLTPDGGPSRQEAEEEEEEEEEEGRGGLRTLLSCAFLSRSRSLSSFPSLPIPSLAADETPTDALVEEKPPALEEPEGGGSQENQEEEEKREEEEGQLPAACGSCPLELEACLPEGRMEPHWGPHPSPQEPPLFSASLAESALEDVETLRLLLRRCFLPSWELEPDEELTPTPSVAGACQPWDVALPSQEEPLEEGGSRPAEEPPRLPLPWEAADSSREPEPGEPQGPDAAQGVPTIPEGPLAAEVQGGLKVVRKGNYFYVSLPAFEGESHTEAARSPGPLDAADPSHQPKRPPLDGPLPSPQQAPPEDAPLGAPGTLAAPTPVEAGPSKQMAEELERLFRTIDQLTQKLAWLKDLEVAHQQLLRSLPAVHDAPLGELPPDSGRTTPCHLQEASTSGGPLLSPPPPAPTEPGQVSPGDDRVQEVTL